MDYATFKKRVMSLIGRIEGECPTVEFYHDSDLGKHCANFSDGTTITGNNIARNVMVSWGVGHKAHATI